MSQLELRMHNGVSEIDAEAWDSLVIGDHPFVSHAFLAGLETHGCIRHEYGWQSCPLGLYAADTLVAAAPLYLKGNSHGEFVFDWSWASAYERNGLDYYPKFLCGVPYSPVSGPRLLVGNAAEPETLRRALITAIDQQTEALSLSSAHLNFTREADVEAMSGTDWLPRFDWQFHWKNRGWADFDEFLAALKPKKRKNIRQERAQVAAAGIRCEIRHGDELDDNEWRTLHHLYRSTFDAHGNHPALTDGFFRHLGRSMPRQVVAVLCHRGDRIIGAALCLRSSDTLYGRYWGAEEQIPGLHFEACYYQGIDYCIRHGLQRFEPGAQGEHKIARGFLPVRTRSFHRIRDPRFAAAIADALDRESRGLEMYRADLLAHSPYAEQSGLS
ncbi:MAG TPA: GNAT family N-acetyltransferase [Dokdonella sp.]|uniref:GNAT family N-acetyltransferase n=1 Tax=Dokdonella sp. TaxID=2291710 RepID=UPI002D7F8735|nr:GNAT family N-acetyltransferase [Dokdonella sp.]HET9031729.1 GNAT family N-acetyltransferase [Dokdonella sp.]